MITCRSLHAFVHASRRSSAAGRRRRRVTSNTTTDADGAVDGGAAVLPAGGAAGAVTRVDCLRDGTRVWVRPLVGPDRELLRAGFRGLSAQSRYSRFLHGVSDAKFERMLPVLLDSVDQQRHVAVVLHADGQAIGVGRLVRTAPGSTVADLAVTVADDWQGRGAGTVLARELLARAEDVREIDTVVAADNKASLRMLAALGQLRSDCIGGSCDIVVRVNRARMAAAA
jgi:RimJ/RimL family protein N-acetyltransferase